MTHRVPAFLEGGFRIFFLGAATIAIINMLVWIGYLMGAIELHSQFEPVYWHFHEMMFGLIGAAIAGFLLTAVPNWTGHPALKGLNLAALFGLWVAGRFAVFYSEYTGAYFAAFVDMPLFFILSLYIYKAISAQGSKRNLPIVVMVSALGVANGLIHAEALWKVETAEYGFRFSIALVSTLIMLIGGRIIPNFTANWLKKNGHSVKPQLMNWYDYISILASVFALIAWVLWPENDFVGYSLLNAGLLNMLRLCRWQMLAIFKVPILLILQVAYAWLAVGLFMLGGSIVIDLGYADLAIHALTIGAFSCMILAVMTRASLGHTGREIVASKITITIYLLINIAAIGRLLAGFVEVMNAEFLHISATAWLICFILFIYEYTPYFFTARK